MPPAVSYPSNSLIYLYAVVLLMSQSLANSVRLNTPLLYCGSCRRKFAGISSSVVCGLPIRLAVPEKRFGLALLLAFFDRCGNCGLAESATGSARLQFPSPSRSAYSSEYVQGA